MESSNSITKRIITIFSGSSQQPIAFFPDTPVENILKLICMLFKFPSNTDLLFLDEDGIPVVFSNTIPSGTKLHVQKFESETVKIIGQTEKSKDEPKKEDLIQWKWQNPEKSSHKLKNNDLTVYQPTNETSSYVWGNLIIEKGSIYFTLLFDPFMCCVYGGIYKAGEAYNNIESQFIHSDIGLPELFDSLYVRSTKPHLKIGFAVNMDKKKLVITDAEEKKVKKIISFDSNWSKVSPLLFFKHVVSVTILGCTVNVPDWVKYE